MVLLLFFCGIVFVQIPFHEPWEDEIQAWLIARDCSIPQIFYMMRYEGHFALWHLLLHPFAQMGLPLITMNIISSLLTVCSVWFILFRSPFVRFVKLLLLASASLLYWYPVVARVYALVPPLLFMLAASYAERKTHPWRIAVLLALLANTHAYMEGFVFSVFCILLYELFLKEWPRLTSSERKKRLAALMLVVLGAMIAFLQVVPAFAVTREASVRFHTPGEFFMRHILIFQSFANYYMFAANPIVLFLFWASFLCFMFVLLRASVTVFIILVVGIFWELFFAVSLYSLASPQQCYLIQMMMVFAAWCALEENQYCQSKAWSKASKRRFTLMVPLCLFIAFSYRMTLLYIPFDLLRPFTNNQETAAYIRNSIPENASIYFFPGTLANSTISVYLPNHSLRIVDTLRPCTYLTLDKERLNTIQPEHLSACLAASPEQRIYVITLLPYADALESAAKAIDLSAICLFQSTELGFPSLCGVPHVVFLVEPADKQAL